MQRAYPYQENTNIGYKIMLALTMLFMFTIPWENVIIISGIGTTTRLMGTLLLGFWFFYTISQRKFRQLTIFHWLAYSFIGWCICTGIWSIHFDYTFVRISTFLQTFIILLVVWNSVVSYRALLYALQSFVLGSFVIIANLYYNFAIGNTSQWEQRATISGSNENDIGLIMAICLPMSWYLVNQKSPFLDNIFLRIINFIYFPAAMVGIFLTASRGSMIASLPYIIYILWGMRGYSWFKRILLTLILAIALFVAYSFVPEASLSRILTTYDRVTTLNLTGREYYWQQGVALWSSSFSNSLIGTGSGTFSWAIGNSAHNSLISVMVETGVVGLIIFIGILVTIICITLTLPREEAMLWLCTLSIWFIGNMALSWEHRKLTWLLWSLIVVNAAFAKQANMPAREENGLLLIGGQASLTKCSTALTVKDGSSTPLS